MQQNTTLSENEYFVNLSMTAPTESPTRLTREQQLARWKAMTQLAGQLRDQLFIDPRVRKQTLVARQELPSQFRIEITLVGAAGVLAKAVKKIKTSADAFGLHIDTSLDLS